MKKDFLLYLKAERNYSEKTIRAYEDSLNAFQEFLWEENGCKVGWLTIHSGDIREWIVSMMDKGSAPSSVNLRLSALRSFYKYLLMKKEVSVNPTELITGPKIPKKLPKFLRESQINELLDVKKFATDYEGVRDRFIILLFYTTGIRLAELLNLRVTDIDFYSSTIKVLGKRNKQRIIPFSDELCEETKIYLAKREETFPDTSINNLFLSLKGEPLKPGKTYMIVRECLLRVSPQKNLSPHVLRHSFATAMLNNGANLEVVKELLGHESLGTTQIYTHTTFEELRKEYEKAHPRGGK